jgi:hypothetical protein
MRALNMNKCGSSPYGPDARRPFLAGPLTRSKSREPCPKEVPHCPQIPTSNVLRVHEKGSQINMPECRQGFTLTQTHGLRFPPQPRYICFKVPRKEAPLQVPLRSSCIEKDDPSPEHSLRISQSRQKRTPPPSRIPLHSPYIEKDAPSPEHSLLISQSPQKRTPPPLFHVPLTEPLHKERLFHRPSPLCISFNAPQKETPPPPVSPYGAPPSRQMFRLQSPLCISFKVPRKEAPPSRFPPKQGRSISEARLYSSLKNPGKEPPT